MEQLARKDFELNLKVWSGFITLKYQQATMRETIDFLIESQKDWFKYLEWLYNFISSKTNISREIFDQMLWDANKIFEAIKSTYFRWVFTADGKKSDSETPFSSYLVLLAKELSLDPLSIIDRYTFEQIAYLTEWIVWNYNEQTPEWRKRNRIEAVKKEMKEEWTNDLDEIKALEERLKNKQQ